ncbi:hypothetical protein MEN41_18850 [Dolichospermum sp. ST_con]|nr:hypothetical protein [Dolichospermum sp. ST_con]MDD1457693.1 hypothetical protein [Dolichospermum sp. ST_sed7]MDD1474731.1 hypothetical protein [Dolichospermum sp. ST_sed4]
MDHFYVFVVKVFVVFAASTESRPRHASYQNIVSDVVNNRVKYLGINQLISSQTNTNKQA